MWLGKYVMTDAITSHARDIWMLCFVLVQVDIE
jgi:hypothetical protein